jgi:hypothetical protein
MMDRSRPRPFHERFDIEVGIGEARQRFVNRVKSVIFQDFMEHRLMSRRDTANPSSVAKNVAYRLGDDFSTYDPELYIRNDYRRCLQALEATYEMLEGSGLEAEFSTLVKRILHDSEVDLGIDWQPPMFVRTGALLLDEHLVNEPLRWLAEPKYKSVRQPFEKGLSHYLEAQNRPDRLADVITDMYEAVEALAKVVTGKDRDLSKNRELFVKNLRLSDYYKRLLKDYIEYGSEFRHAERLGKPRPQPSEPEVESFIYLTGLFIRLAIRTT